MASLDDWYRKTTWSPEDAAEFECRLIRSRGQRTQYLKLQAWHLAETGRPALADAAIQLAERYLKEDPGGFFEVQAHLIIAKASGTKGDIERAVSAYRDAVRAERNRRGPRSAAFLEYAWFSATNSLVDSYQDVLRAMNGVEETDLVFPLGQYKYFAALALISDDLKDRAEAKRMARNALNAVAGSSPFPRHPDVGVVKDIPAKIRARVKRLAA